MLAESPHTWHNSNKLTADISLPISAAQPHASSPGSGDTFLVRVPDRAEMPQGTLRTSSTVRGAQILVVGIHVAPMASTQSPGDQWGNSMGSWDSGNQKLLCSGNGQRMHKSVTDC